jgi:hypothetical protein
VTYSHLQLGPSLINYRVSLTRCLPGRRQRTLLDSRPYRRHQRISAWRAVCGVSGTNSGWAGSIGCVGLSQLECREELQQRCLVCGSQGTGRFLCTMLNYFAFKSVITRNAAHVSRYKGNKVCVSDITDTKNASLCESVESGHS